MTVYLQLQLSLGLGIFQFLFCFYMLKNRYRYLIHVHSYKLCGYDAYWLSRFGILKMVIAHFLQLKQQFLCFSKANSSCNNFVFLFWAWRKAATILGGLTYNDIAGCLFCWLPLVFHIFEFAKFIEFLEVLRLNQFRFGMVTLFIFFSRFDRFW